MIWAVCTDTSRPSSQAAASPRERPDAPRERLRRKSRTVPAARHRTAAPVPTPLHRFRGRGFPGGMHRRDSIGRWVCSGRAPWEGRHKRPFWTAERFPQTGLSAKEAFRASRAAWVSEPMVTTKMKSGSWATMASKLRSSRRPLSEAAILTAPASSRISQTTWPSAFALTEEEAARRKSTRGGTP